MAGRGPAPKDPKTRRRRNRASTAAKVKGPETPPLEIPLLPEGRGGGPNGAWHVETGSWWVDLWRSAIAAEYVAGIDGHTLLVFAVVLDRFWHDPSKELATEIRLQAREFGLNPMARRSLQWQVKPRGSGEDKPEPGKGGKATEGDPRERLTLVK
jgi:hypothetical protein